MSAQSYVFAVTGSKDGIGKSNFSLNLAISLHKTSNARVLVIDFDTENCGDIKNLAGLTDIISITGIADSLHKLDREAFATYLTKHNSGISLIELYKRKNELRNLSASTIEAFINLARQSYNFIVIDCGNKIDTFSYKPYEFANFVFFLTNQNITTLQQGAKKLSELQSLHIPGEMIAIILNEFNPKSVITKQIVGQKFRKDVLLSIPKDETLFEYSVTKGIPITIAGPTNAVSKCIFDLAGYIISEKFLKYIKPAAGSGAIGFDVLQDINPSIGKSGDTAHSVSRDIFSQKKAAINEFNNEIKIAIHKKLIDVMDLKSVDPTEISEKNPKKFAELKVKTRETINRLLDEAGAKIQNLEDRRRLAKEIYDEALGLGALEDLLADTTVSEIMVNGPNQIYVEQGGKLVLTNMSFTTDKHLLGVIERIVAPIGRRIDEKTPMVDARLKDGSRVNAIIPPLSLTGPMITIRKFSKEPLTYKDLIKFGTLTEDIADLMRACIEARLNCVVSGGTGSGKTTLLNVMASFIPTNERIITIEDSAELQLPQEHVGTLETRPPNLQGENEISIRDLVKNALRMRPDRIIVGECRGAEALDMLQAMNTGHDGSMTTLHANSPRDCMQRLETLVMYAGYDLPSKAIREQIASAVHMIFQLNRMSDGSRRITHITEVTGIEGDKVVLQDIFVFKQKGVDEKGRVIGRFESTGLVPKFLETLKEKGIRIPKGLFSGVK